MGAAPGGINMGAAPGPGEPRDWALTHAANPEFEGLSHLDGCVVTFPTQKNHVGNNRF